MAVKKIENTEAVDNEAVPENTAPDMDEFVEVTLFKDNKDYKDDVFVAVNGESIKIKRGVPVMIKRKFKEVLDSQQKQDNATAAMMSEKEEAFKKETEARKI